MFCRPLAWRMVTRSSQCTSPVNRGGRSSGAFRSAGLAEKLFPRGIVEKPILLDAARERLNADLPTNKDRLAQEGLALAVAYYANKWVCWLTTRCCPVSCCAPTSPL